jgi:hypothetical protein
MQAVFGWAIAIRGCFLLGVPLVYLALTATMLHDAPAVEPRDAGEGVLLYCIVLVAIFLSECEFYDKKCLNFS